MLPSFICGAISSLEAPRGVPGLIRDRHDANPGLVACEDAERSITYHELELLSDSLAAQLAGLARGPGPVVIRVPKGVDVAVAALGVLKAGYSYLPLSVTEPAQRVAAMAAAAAPAAVIDAGGAGPAPLAGLPRLSVPRTAGEAAPRPLPEFDARRPVYVMPTSGSTGEPKGAVVNSAGLCNCLLWLQRTYALRTDDRLLQKSPHSFDIFGWELWWPLTAGARCVVASEGDNRDLAALAALIAARRVSVCFFVPSVLAEFLRVPAAAGTPSLRMIFSGGEALTTSLARRASRSLTAELHNIYGPAEASILVTSWPVPRELGDNDPVLLGAPIDNTCLLIAGADGEPAPQGSAGELWISGVPLAEGYVGRPDLTVSAFPFRFGRRWYRTGDLVRRSDAGLEFVGRADDQVKVGGVRVEPLEIEHVLTRQPGVGQAGVAQVRDSAGSAWLAAAVIPLAGAVVDDGWLRRQVAAALPSAFVPSAFFRPAELPLNSNGKLDRRRLGELAQRWWDDRARAPGANDLVSSAWAHALPDGQAAEEVGFLSAGGGSLAAVRLVSKLRDVLGVEVPLRLLLDENASLAELRGLAMQARPAAPRPAGRPPSLGAGTELPASPLAPEQRRLWLIGAIYGEQAAYNVVSVLRFAGQVDQSALAAALAGAVRRHDILRARVITDEPGEPRLRFAPEARLSLLVKEISGPLSPEAIDAHAASFAAGPVSTERAPMARASLLRSADAAQACLVLVLNHLVADQASMDLLLAEVAQEYAGVRAGVPVTLEAGPSYARYATDAAALAGTGAWAADVEYWRDTLRGAPPKLLMPFRAEAGSVPDFRGAAHTVELDAGFCDRLRRYLRGAQATTACFFLAAFATVLAAWSGQESVVIGMPSSRRRHAEEQRLVGFLVDSLPIRLDVAEHENFASLIVHARSRYAEALDHSLPTFDDLMRALRLPSRPPGNPVFQVWLNDLTGGGAAPAFDGLRTEQVVPPSPGALFDLGLYLHRRADGIAVQLVRASASYASDVAAELLDQCVAVATSAVSAAERAAGAVGRAPRPACELVTERAAAVLPDPGAAPALAGPRATVLAGIAAVASARPASLAVAGDTGSLTYGQLWQETERQAGRLRAHGVVPGDLVELRARRTARLPVALLAGWHAGAAVALVDAGLPQPRLAQARQLLAPRASLTIGDGGDVSIEGCLDQASRPGQAEDDGGFAAASGKLSHVLLTSGTTGEPELVAVPHGPLRDFLRWYPAEFGLTADDRFALMSGTGHDPVLRDLLTPLWLGATLRVPPAEVFADWSRLRRWLAGESITVLHATPGLMRMILAAAGPDLAALRLLVLGGAPLTYGLAAEIRSVSSARIVNAYGTTETPQIAACYLLADTEAARRPPDARVPVGVGVAGHDLLVRTPDGRLAGIGQRGEVVIRSRNLASGYLGGPRRDNFGIDHATGTPTFRTGDAGRYDPGGRVHLDGRLDRQVSVGGHRVELGDVESAALRHPAVRHAEASLAGDALGPVLTLRADLRPDQALTADELRRHLRDWLPAPAVPVSIDVAAGFGLPSHKVRLTPPAPGGAATAAAPAARPDGPVAAWLTAKLSEVTGSQVQADANFFDLGLNSITLLELHAMMTAELGLAFPVTALFAYPNVRALSGFLGGDAGREATAGRVTGADPGRLRQAGQARLALRRGLRDQPTEAGYEND